MGWRRRIIIFGKTGKLNMEPSRKVTTAENLCTADPLNETVGPSLSETSAPHGASLAGLRRLSLG